MRTDLALRFLVGRVESAFPKDAPGALQQQSSSIVQRSQDSVRRFPSGHLEQHVLSFESLEEVRW
jgi:hypothetical protein